MGFVRSTEDEQEKWVSDFNNGKSCVEIAHLYHRSHSTIRRYFIKKGIVEPTAKSGEKHPSWKGGRFLQHDGYVSMKINEDDPFFSMVGVKGYVLEHRYVMAQFLGRCLTENETVHHLDGNKQNNNIQNLQLRQGNHGKGITFICACCGSFNVVPTTI